MTSVPPTTPTIPRPSLGELLTADGLHDPTSTYRAWREWEESHGQHPTMVLSRAGIIDVYSNPDMSAARIGNVIRSAPDDVQQLLAPLESTLSAIIAFQDPPDHTRIRSIMARSFTPRVVRHQEHTVHDVADRLVRRMATTGNDDLVSAVSHPMPSMVIGAMLGIPDDHLDQFADWAVKLVYFVGSSAPSADEAVQIADALAEMNDLFGTLACRRRADPTDDLFSSMLAVADAEEGPGITDEELFANALFLMTAGHETATNAITNGMLALLGHPDQRARLDADRSLLDTAVDEMLRYDSPIQVSARLCATDTVVAGRERCAGEPVVLVIGAGNHDPDAYEQPNRFDIARRPNRHLSFGHGAHHCLGASLARSELRVVVASLLDAFPRLDLDASQTLEWQPTLNFRGVRRLVVTT